MRNLKRALCFALAAVMVLGLMITGAGAASTYDNFTDKDEIVHQEAVNTMVSLGVINGKEDGSYYDPTATVTRAEMTKVVAVALNGGKDPVFSDNDKTTFSDTQGHWAEKYIAYCVRQGIVAGRGDNSFGPDDPLTGSACAKMFLCALGYRADLEGFVNVGSDWELNVNVKANQDAKLYDELSEITASDDLTRDSMAQMLYNAVQANEVIYDNLYGDYSGVIQAVPNGTMLANRFGVAKVEGVVIANEIVSIEDAYGPTVSGKIRLADVKQNGTDYEDKDGNKLTAVYPVGLDNEYLGQRVVLYVKGLKDLSPNASNMTLVGEPILSDDNTVAETASRMKDAAAVRSFLSDNGLSMPDGTIPAGVANGTVSYSKDNTVRGATLNRTFAVTSASNVNGTEFTFIDHDGDGQVDYIFKTLPQMAKVTVYNENDEKLTIAGEGSIDFSDIANPEDVAKDDIVLYYKMGDTWYMNVAETVSGKVAAYNNNNKKVTVDGTDYGMSTVGVTTTSTDLTAFASDMEFVDNTYTFYLDNHGNAVAWVLDESGLGDLAMVIGADVSGNPGFKNASVKLLLPDGTTGTYDVNLLSSANRFGLAPSDSNSAKENAMANALAGNKMDNTIVTYAIAENSKDVTLGDPAQPSTQDVITANPAPTPTPGNGTSYYTSKASDKVARSTSRYTFEYKANGGTAGSDANISVNDSTVFFIRNYSDVAAGNTNDAYTVVNGLSNMPTTTLYLKQTADANVAKIDNAVYSTTDTNRNVAKAVVVDGYYKGSSNYVFLTDSYTGTQNVNGERVYTYPAVFEDGTKGEIKTTDGTHDKNEVYSYTLDSRGFAELTQPAPSAGAAGVMNGYVTTYTRGSNITVTLGDGSGSSVSRTLVSKPAVWNTEEDTPVAETLSTGMSVAMVVDGDGFVKTVFVYDTNVTRAHIVLAEGVVAAGISYANEYVYSGFDAVLNGFTAPAVTVAYTVNYGSRTENLTKTKAEDAVTATISVPKNAETITVTAPTTGGGGGGSDEGTDSLDKAAGSNQVIAQVDKTNHKILLKNATNGNAALTLNFLTGQALTGAEGAYTQAMGMYAAATGSALTTALTNSTIGNYVIKSGPNYYTLEFAKADALDITSANAKSSTSDGNDQTTFKFTLTSDPDVNAKSGTTIKVYDAATGSSTVTLDGSTPIAYDDATKTLTIKLGSALDTTTTSKDLYVEIVGTATAKNSDRVKLTAQYKPVALSGSAITGGTATTGQNTGSIAGSGITTPNYNASHTAISFKVYDAATDGTQIGTAAWDGTTTTTLNITLTGTNTFTAGANTIYIVAVCTATGVEGPAVAATVTAS